MFGRRISWASFSAAAKSLQKEGRGVFFVVQVNSKKRGGRGYTLMAKISANKMCLRIPSQTTLKINVFTRRFVIVPAEKRGEFVKMRNRSPQSPLFRNGYLDLCRNLQLPLLWRSLFPEV
jgi:hypothetical protein